jgi:hypothetical protein
MLLQTWKTGYLSRVLPERPGFDSRLQQATLSFWIPVILPEVYQGESLTEI